MEEIKVSEMLQADSIEKDNAVMIIQDGVNKKAGGSIETATGTSLSLTSVADTCKVTSNSKNMFDGKLELGTYSDAGVPSDASTNYRNVNKIKVEPETIYTFSINGTSQKYAVYYYNASGEFISAEGLTGGTFTTPASCYFVNFRCFNADYTSDYANLKLQLEEGSTATDYNPYNIEVKITDGTNIQNIILTPQEEKYAFTYDSLTNVMSDGNITIEYNTQSRLLNNDDTTAIKEYVDRIAEEKSQDVYSTTEKRIGTWIDGKPLYRKVLESDIITSGEISLLTITNEIVTKIEGFLFRDSGFIQPYGSYSADGSTYTTRCFNDGSYIKCQQGTNWQNNNTKARVIIEYTKTTD